MTEKSHAFLDLLEGLKGHQPNFTARCPGHKDHVNSLSIALTKDRILLKCHAGCAAEDIVKALGLTFSDLFLNSHKPTPATKEIDKVYQYHNYDGTLLFEVVRFRPKSFAQRRPDGQWGLAGVRPVLYHLPDVLTAIQNRDVIYLVEGEKDVETLRGVGCVATTSPMGAGKWRDSYSVVMRNAMVVIIPDSDEPGRHHAFQAALSIYPFAQNIRILYLPDTIKDISDWFALGHSRTELDEWAEKASCWEPPRLDTIQQLRAELIYLRKQLAELQNQRTKTPPKTQYQYD